MNVVYGFIGLKTHGKTTLIVRQERDMLRRYIHLSTGNYNSSTAKSYVDIGIVTADPDIGHDISTLFNLLTGFNIFTKTSALTNWTIPEFKKIVASPIALREKFVSLIRKEADSAKRGLQSKIVAKMNALVDKDIIEELYQASQEGVSITLIVRGICCLRPGVEGLSDNIEVISIVDRFLEHSRIYFFESEGAHEVYISSADWMPRNMDRRVEILLPIFDPICKQRLISEILDCYLSDNVKAKQLTPKGNYEHIQSSKSAAPSRAQSRFIELAREIGLKSIPYEKAIRHKRKSGRRPLHKKHSSKTIIKLKQKKDES